MSHYALEGLRDAGVRGITIILSDVGYERMIEYYCDGAKFDMNVTYIDQGEPKGLVHAMGLTRDCAREEAFALYLGDNLLQNWI